MTASYEVRPGAYYDSVVLMQLQRALAGLPEVIDAGVVMGTAANLELLAQNDLLPEEMKAAPEDLVIVVEAGSKEVAETALGQVDELLSRRRSVVASEFRPKSLRSAAEMLPESDWVLISVPGRYAAAVANEAIDLGKSVFLYSDNVSLDDEVELKARADELELLVMGPDCGTAIVGGIGFGFANHVRRGAIGLVGASGTGLQAITSRIHQQGEGVSQALGTGSRDLKEGVAAATAARALNLLANDPETEVVVLVSKPPDPGVTARLLQRAWASGKPTVVSFIGYPPPSKTTRQSALREFPGRSGRPCRRIGRSATRGDQSLRTARRSAVSTRPLRRRHTGGRSTRRVSGCAWPGLLQHRRSTPERSVGQ